MLQSLGYNREQRRTQPEKINLPTGKTALGFVSLWERWSVLRTGNSACGLVALREGSDLAVAAAGSLSRAANPQQPRLENAPRANPIPETQFALSTTHSHSFTVYWVILTRFLAHA